MPNFRKDAQGNKIVRVPEELKRNIERVIEKSRTVRANCPFGHDIRVNIEIKYIPREMKELYLGVNIRGKKSPKGPKMVPSEEPFTDEYFEALLAAPLREREKRFVRFFQERGNEPVSPMCWMQKYFSEFVHRRQINSLCKRHRIPISILPTGEYDNVSEDVMSRVDPGRIAQYKFYVMQPAGRARD